MLPLQPAAAANPPIDPHQKAVVGIARGSNMEDAVRARGRSSPAVCISSRPTRQC